MFALNAYDKSYFLTEKNHIDWIMLKFLKINYLNRNEKVLTVHLFAVRSIHLAYYKADKNIERDAASCG
jgi:hypothetical protein